MFIMVSLGLYEDVEGIITRRAFGEDWQMDILYTGEHSGIK